MYDWTGPYVGLGYGMTSGNLKYNTIPTDFDLNNGNAVSIFAGYRMQSGSLVYGGELAYSRGSKTYATDPPVFFTTENVSRIIDLKGKVGYAADRALFYGVIGYSSMKYDIPAVANSFTTDGVNYGVGVDFAVSNQVTMGLEYLVRRTSGDSYIPGQTAKLNVNTVSLRVAYKF